MRLTLVCELIRYRLAQVRQNLQNSYRLAHTHARVHTHTHTHTHMAVIDWWNGPLTLVVIFFALCLLLLTWSTAGVACRACHSSGTFFHCDTHTHMLLTWSIAGVTCCACHSSGTFFHCDTHTHTHTHTLRPPSPFHSMLYCNNKILVIFSRCSMPSFLAWTWRSKNLAGMT